MADEPTKGQETPTAVVDPAPTSPPAPTVEPTPNGATLPAQIATGEGTATPTAPQTPTWQSEIDRLDAGELRKHPKVAGLIGSEAQRLWQQKTKTDVEAAQRKAREDQEKAFLDLVEGNTDYIKEHHPLVYERSQALQSERVQRDLAGIRGSTVKEIGEAIGQTLREMPEGQQMLTDEQAMTSLAGALQNKADHEVLAIVYQHAVDYAAERRAATKVEAALAKRDKEWEEKLVKDREATRQEERAKHLAASAAPDGKPSKREPPKLNIASMSDDEFTSWWDNRNA